MSKTSAVGWVTLGALALLGSGVVTFHPKPAPIPAPTVAPTPVAVASPPPHPASPPPPDPFSAPRWTAANGALLAWIVALGLLPFAVGLALALRARHRSRLLEMDRPPLRDRESVAMAYHWKTTAADASRGTLQSLSLSQRYHNEGGPPPALAGNVHLPTLDEMLRLPGIVYGVRVDTGQPLLDSRTLSTAIGGVQGSGKTTTAALIVAQHYARKADILVGDLDADHEQGLVQRLEGLIGPLRGDRMAADPRDILRMTEGVYEELENRQRTWSLRTPEQKRPVLLVLDEFPQLVRRLADKRGRLLDILQIIGGYSGRKYLMAALLLAQSWAQEAVTTTQIRNLAAVMIAHRMRSAEATTLTGVTREAMPVDTFMLDDGEALVAGLGDVARVRMPSLDAPQVVPMSSALPPAAPSERLELNGSTSGAQPDDKRRAQILKLAAQGLEVKEIVAKLYGIEKTGRSYTAAAREVWAVVTGQLAADEAQ